MNMFGLTSYRDYTDSSAVLHVIDGALDGTMINRIKGVQLEILKTKPFVIVYNSVEGGSAFLSLPNRICGNMFVAGYDDEEVFKVELANSMDIFGAYKR